MTRFEPLSWEEIERAYSSLSREEQKKIAVLDDNVNMGYLDFVRDLIESGTDVNCRNIVGETPLITAAHTGQPEMVRLLLDLGADPSLRDREDRTALERARSYEHDFVVAVFEKQQ